MSWLGAQYKAGKMYEHTTWLKLNTFAAVLCHGFNKENIAACGYKIVKSTIVSVTFKRMCLS